MKKLIFACMMIEIVFLFSNCKPKIKEPNDLQVTATVSPNPTEKTELQDILAPTRAAFITPTVESKDQTATPDILYRWRKSDEALKTNNTSESLCLLHYTKHVQNLESVKELITHHVGST